MTETGWIKLHRKLLEGRIFQDPVLLKVWVWCLLRAVHKDQWVTVKTGRGETIVHLERGQFLFGRNSASLYLTMPPSTLRRKLLILCELQAITLKPDTHFSIVTILNYELYQDTWTGNRTGNGHPTDTYKNDKNEKKKESPEISAEISALREKLFSSPKSQDLFSRIIEAISLTRKSSRISPSVILAFLKKLAEYPEAQIVAGFETYLAKEYHHEGKKEEYLLGIIRNHKTITRPEPEDPFERMFA